MSKYEREDLTEYEREMKWYRTLSARELGKQVTVGDTDYYYMPSEVQRRLELLERIERYHSDIVRRLEQSFDDWIAERRERYAAYKARGGRL